MKRRAFTLVELLVVIAIVGLLSTVAVVNLQTTRSNAKITKARADLKQLATTIDLARQNSNTYLMAITGSNCTYCSYCGSGDLRNIVEASVCAQGMITTINIINAAAGKPAITKAWRDPWGSPYQIDENEAETTGPDNIWSVGPNGSRGDSDDIMLDISKFGI